MRSRFLAIVLFGLSLSGEQVALAARPLPDFREPAPMTEEQLREAKEQGRLSIPKYSETMEEKPKPFPWPAVILFSLCFLVAAPFAVRAYLRTAKEIGANEQSPRSSRPRRAPSVD
jgi:hypothetical protein